MFTWVGAQFDAILSTYVLGVVSALMTAIAPIALAAMTLWVVFYGWAVLRNEVSETLPNFMWKVFKIGVVLAFALQAGFYIANVADTADALATGVAATFLPAAVNPLTIASPYAMLDAFNDQANLLVLDLLKNAGITRLDLLFAAVVCSIGNVIFLCIALFVVSLAKLLLTFVIAVGPIFMLCLAWRPTQRFFDSWLSMVLNTVVLSSDSAPADRPQGVDGTSAAHPAARCITINDLGNTSGERHVDHLDQQRPGHYPQTDTR
ncbi:MAG: type IV secretion system protein [Rubrivivax sp.]